MQQLAEAAMEREAYAEEVGLFSGLATGLCCARPMHSAYSELAHQSHCCAG